MCLAGGGAVKPVCGNVRDHRDKNDQKSIGRQLSMALVSISAAHKAAWCGVETSEAIFSPGREGSVTVPEGD